MKALLIAATLFAVPTVCAAEEAWRDEPWRESAVESVMDYDRIRQTEWAYANDLWLYVYPADVAWDVVTDGIICWSLRSGGMPADYSVRIAWVDFGAALRGEVQVIARAECG